MKYICNKLIKSCYELVSGFLGNFDIEGTSLVALSSGLNSGGNAISVSGVGGTSLAASSINIEGVEAEGDTVSGFSGFSIDSQAEDSKSSDNNLGELHFLWKIVKCFEINLLMFYK